MNSVSLGDLAQFFLLRNQVGSVQHDMNDKLKELSTGEVSDLSSHVSGNFSEISAIEHDLKVGESYLSVINSASTFLNAQELAFGKARSKIAGTGVALVDAAESSDQNRRAAVLAESGNSFDLIVSALNTQVAGRSVFSGISTQSSAFAAPNEILANFEAALTTASTASDVWSVADAWFGIGGNYDSVAYHGSPEALDGFKVSREEIVRPTLTGYDPEVRNLLKLHAISAVLADGMPALIEQEKSNLMAEVGQEMINLDRALVSRHAELGGNQTRVEELLVENSAQRYALLGYRKELLGKDVSETVMGLSEAQNKLEAIFTITSRVSQLSLVKFL
ncbi:hypothetical protein [Mangrovicoccus sp. HB161399]|uniref:hypothetical protein n=1 Tax=Mangrovicoccus sp. HB161399 TaxID=2720392 RepID=UPI001554045B|nr:hypothetical protein [Mangrovicoccus sp. HB161399]